MGKARGCSTNAIIIHTLFAEIDLPKNCRTAFRNYFKLGQYDNKQAIWHLILSPPNPEGLENCIIGWKVTARICYQRGYPVLCLSLKHTINYKMLPCWWQTLHVLATLFFIHILNNQLLVKRDISVQFNFLAVTVKVRLSFKYLWKNKIKKSPITRTSKSPARIEIRVVFQSTNQYKTVWFRKNTSAEWILQNIL